MTYHNFVTGERIFDYQMKDKKLREICIDNMYGTYTAQLARADVIHAKRVIFHFYIAHLHVNAH
jgi:hypothetical protein